ncbi:MAG: ATP-dependent exonuclease SbcCD, C subunit-like protein, partial [Clostridia bacterium]
NRKIDSLSKAENGILNVLREQLQQAEQEKETQKGAVEDTIVKVDGLKNQIDATKTEQNANLAKLEIETAVERGAYAYLAQNKSRWLGASELTLENSASQEKRYGGSLQNERNKMNDSIQTLEKAIIKDIAYFRREFPNETREMDDAVESLPECQHMLEQLETDALPKYEANFKNLLTSQVINRIASFHMELKSQYKKVKDRIQDINESLRQIDYNPGRYIRLNCEDSPDAEIKDFRAGLKACTEGASGGFDDEELATARFLQIKEILQRFQGRDKETETDKRWTKK